MSCVGNTITSMDDMLEAVRRCGVEYGGEGWESQAMTGGAAVLILLFAVVVMYLTLQGLRR